MSGCSCRVSDATDSTMSCIVVTRTGHSNMARAYLIRTLLCVTIVLGGSSAKTVTAAAFTLQLHFMRFMFGHLLPLLCGEPTVLVLQMIQTEADEEERKAIQRHVFRAFNDFGGEATSDSNPLARPTKLTRTNPLL